MFLNVWPRIRIWMSSPTNATKKRSRFRDSWDPVEVQFSRREIGFSLAIRFSNTSANMAWLECHWESFHRKLMLEDLVLVSRHDQWYVSETAEWMVGPKRVMIAHLESRLHRPVREFSIWTRFCHGNRFLIWYWTSSMDFSIYFGWQSWFGHDLVDFVSLWIISSISIESGSLLRRI
jgi:hypothetical protein